jgi:hypothetical protein
MGYILSLVVAALIGVTADTAFARRYIGHEVLGAIADQGAAV